MCLPCVPQKSRNEKNWEKSEETHLAGFRSIWGRTSDGLATRELLVWMLMEEITGNSRWMMAVAMEFQFSKGWSAPSIYSFLTHLEFQLGLPASESRELDGQSEENGQTEGGRVCGKHSQLGAPFSTQSCRPEQALVNDPHMQRPASVPGSSSCYTWLACPSGSHQKLKMTLDMTAG